MNKYEHDTERWLRSQASLYRSCHNRELAEKFSLCAADVKRLHSELSALKEAARPVVEACYAADADGELDGRIDGEMLFKLAALVGEE